MIIKSKTDPELGRKVSEYISIRGKQTPAVRELSDDIIPSLSNDFKTILTKLGLDLNDDSLSGTPDRIAKMWVNDFFYGLNWDNFPKCTTIENKMGYDELVVEKDIITISNCEHHFVIIDGVTHIGYIPNKKVIGLSKMNRIVDFFLNALRCRKD